MMFRKNLGYRSRVLRMVGGGVLAGYALARNGRPGVNDVLFTMGVVMTMEGLHGYCPMGDIMGWSTHNQNGLLETEG